MLTFNPFNTLLYTISYRKVNTPFILSIDKWYLFHILSSLELCIPLKCHKCTVLKTWVKPLLSPKASLLCVADVFRVTWSPSHFVSNTSPKCIDHAKKAWEDVVQGLLGKVNHKTRTFSWLFHIHEMHLLALLGLFQSLTEMTDLFF